MGSSSSIRSVEVALLNEILGISARFNSLLTRKFSIIGGAPAPQITPEISPTFAFPRSPEDLVLMGELIATGIVNIPAVALKLGVAQLRNPASSGYVLVVEHAEVENLGAGNNDFIGAVGFTSGDLAQLPAAGGLTLRETRTAQVGAVTRAPVGHLTFDQSPPTILTPNLFLRTGPVFSVFQYDQPVILAPGAAIQLSCNVANIPIVAAFAWREVPVNPGEVGPF